jgi:hypothetical protein
MLNFKSFLKENLIPSQEYLLESDLLEEQWLLLTEESAGQKTEADDKGKLYELLTSGYMHPQTEEKFHPNPNSSGFKLPEHHRSESENPDHAGTPQQVHDKLRKKVGEAAYQEINRHAHEMSGHIKKDLAKKGHIGKDGMELGESFWTSNPDKINKNGQAIGGDHMATTGIHDPNAKGDFMVRLHKRGADGKLIMGEDGKPKIFGHKAFSAKYGYQKKANLANMGLDTMEKHANLASGSLDVHQIEHKKKMDGLNYDGSADQRNIQTKIDEMPLEDTVNKKGEKVPGIHSEFKRLSAQHAEKPLSGKDKIMHEHLGKFLEAGKTYPGGLNSLKIYAQGRAAEARKSADDATKIITKHVADGLHGNEPNTEEGNKARDARLRETLHKIVSPPTAIEHSIVHTHVQRDGSAAHHIIPMAGMGESHTSRFTGLHVSHKGANNIVIKGRLNEPGHPKHDTVMNVATLSAKTGSGAHKGRVFTAKLENQKTEEQ